MGNTSKATNNCENATATTFCNINKMPFASSNQYQQTDKKYLKNKNTYFFQVFLNLIPYWGNLHTVKAEVAVCINEIRFCVTFR